MTRVAILATCSRPAGSAPRHGGANGRTVLSISLIRGLPGDAQLADKLQFIVDRPEWAVGPGLVAGLALLHIPVWLGLAAAMWAHRPAAGLLAVRSALCTRRSRR